MAPWSCLPTSFSSHLLDKVVANTQGARAGWGESRWYMELLRPSLHLSGMEMEKVPLVGYWANACKGIGSGVLCYTMSRGPASYSLAHSSKTLGISKVVILYMNDRTSSWGT